MVERVPASLASWKPFTGKGTARLRRDIICYHTMVGTLLGSWAWANGAGRPYWHFGTGGDGACLQCHGLEYRSASNLYGNPYVIPIENADMGPGFGPWNGQCGSVPPLTDLQLERLIPLTAHLCVRYDIPPEFIPDTRAGRRGIAWHRQGIEGWPEWNGGLLWSRAAGKCCPDDDRIHQLKTIIVPEVRRLVGAPSEIPDPGDQMPSAQEVALVTLAGFRDSIDRGGDANDELRLAFTDALQLGLRKPGPNDDKRIVGALRDEFKDIVKEAIAESA